VADSEDRVGAASTSPSERRWSYPIREYAWPLELHALLRDPVWRGQGVPAGDGRPVLLIPGFMAGDGSLRMMATWLVRRGYRVEMSGIRWNVACSDRTLVDVEARLCRLAEETGARVSLVGHSRGGLFAKTLAGRRPDLVERVIALGSPLADPFDIATLTNAAVTWAKRLEWRRNPESRQRGCFTLECECILAAARAEPVEVGVPIVSVITREDGVVNPDACLLPGADVMYVRGTHIGLAWNRHVYRILSGKLAQNA
jgi:triacylglycerol lipase